MAENKNARAGVAQIDITPPIGSDLGAYPHRRIAKSVKSKLYSKALVVENDGRRIAIVSNDLSGSFKKFTDPAKARIAATCGIPPEAVMICATHTHTGPALRDRRPSGGAYTYDPAYIEKLIENIVEGVQSACDSMFDAEIYFGQTEAEGFSRNKLWRLKNGRDIYKLRDEEPAGPAGPLDTSVQVLCVKDNEGRTRAFSVNFATHPNTGLEDEIWAEWPGELARTIALVYGENVPCLLLQGTAGDVDCNNSISREQVGRGIAGAAIMATERESEPVASRPIDFRLRNLSIPRLVKTPETDRMIDEVRNIPEKDKDNLTKCWPVRYDNWNPEPREWEAPVQCLRIGDKAVVGLPAEVFTAIGLEIKRYSPAEDTMVVELANYRVGYLPPIEQAERRGYGEWPFMSRHLVPEAATMITDAAIEMLHEMWDETRSFS